MTNLIDMMAVAPATCEGGRIVVITDAIKPPREVIVGARFGMLEVIGHKKDDRFRLLCLCRCKCGTEKWIRASDLTREGGRDSCGCRWKYARPTLPKHVTAMLHGLTKDELRLALYDAGLTDREAADFCGIDKTTFRKWRNQNRFPANKKPAAMHH